MSESDRGLQSEWVAAESIEETKTRRSEREPVIGLPFIRSRGAAKYTRRGAATSAAPLDG